MKCKIVKIGGQKVRICWETAASRTVALQARDEEETDRLALAASLNALLQPLGLAVVDSSRAAALQDLTLETADPEDGPSTLRA
ncbi:hypothetical protein [Marinimicrococcus flavescens]|uniref:Uncharacterized protein n=1 Tax=Marinimicrococcus flavescens TaxID=3031815 RepID=A0AAP3XPJ3_9PROT|nr:hypothetical protein [Marinimicrococcus flavescens]